MQETSSDRIENILAKQRKFYATDQTKELSFRLQQLKKLKKALKKYQGELEKSIWEDLHKSPEEAYLTEFSIVQSEIEDHLNNLKYWAKPKKVSTPLHLKPSSSHIVYEPLGCALIIAPWNYPIQLNLVPLIGAIGAGCCAIIKPSPDAPATGKVLQKMLEETYEESYIAVVQGGRETNTLLLAQDFDFIFFTGSSKVGKVVMRAAAEHLTPVVLELGGKSPCIVAKEADLAVAAKRIVWAKFINAGQTCIAPDYLLVQDAIKDQLLDKMADSIEEMYGKNIDSSRFYPRIVTEKALERLKELMKEGNIHTGGEIIPSQKFIAPTIIDKIEPHHKIMQEEIFGPLLPVMTFGEIEEAIAYVNNNNTPLALYYFGKQQEAKEVIKKTSSGGVCINDTLMHIANHHLPFGGVGYSGIGKYHGHDSFLAFSNRRAVLSTPTWIDIPLKYVPYKYFDWIKKII